jgi:hypothetical protein
MLKTETDKIAGYGKNENNDGTDKYWKHVSFPPFLGR